MLRRLGCVLLAVAILGSGCLAPAGTGERPVAVAADDESVGGASVGAAGTVDANATVVAVETAGEAAVPVADVTRAVDYWRERATPGSEYAVDPDATNPDVRVRVGTDPVRCESKRDATGEGGAGFYCLEGGSEGNGPTVVTLTPGLTEEGYASALAAALGHLAGVDEPFAHTDIEKPSYADPWPSSDPVTVRIENEANPDRDFEGMVRQTLSYWGRHDERWGTYVADWTVVDDGEADVTVAFVDEVESCGDHPDPESLIGCAPVRSPDNPADGDERVRIVGGYDDETTLLILKHEFGHLYGVSHGDEPTDVMADSIQTTPLGAS